MKQSILIETRVRPQFNLSAFSNEAEDTIGPLEIDRSYAPVPLGSYGVNAFDMTPERESISILRADVEVESTEQLPRMIHEMTSQENVVAVYSDPEIAPIIDCDSRTPKGTSAEIETALNISSVWSSTGTKGEGMIIGILDGGVDSAKYPVVGGWSPVSSFPPGSSPVAWNGHGNMCAFDSLIAAPDAKIFDYAIGRTSGITALLSVALQAMQHALTNYRLDGTPQVLSNSWGLFQQSWDPFPPNHPSNYTHNANHPLNRKVIELIDEGILISFAAGNCGASCPDGRCGRDVGPGRSIRGANGLERVISVGAVNKNDEWIGYSSQGPSTFFHEKPDICGFSHFTGHFNSDSGTSAACPVVAGVLAALKAGIPNLSQDRARAVLKQSARQPGSNPWNDRFGYGIVDAAHAFSMLRSGLPASPSGLVIQ